MPGMGPLGVPMIPGGPGPWGPGGPGMPMAPPQQWGGERRSRSRSPNRYGGGPQYDGGGGYHHGGEVDPLDAYMDGIQQEVGCLQNLGCRKMLKRRGKRFSKHVAK